MSISSVGGYSNSKATDGDVVTIEIQADEDLIINASDIQFFGTSTANTLTLSSSNPPGQQRHYTIESSNAIVPSNPSGTVTFSITYTDLLGMHSPKQ